MLYGQQSVWGGLAALLLMGWGAACAQNDPPAKNPLPVNSGEEKQAANEERAVPVKVTVKTDKKVYRPGEPIKITMTVKNTQKSDVTLRFSSGQQYDLEIRRGKTKNGEKVWQWSEGRMFTLNIHSKSLTPNKSMSFEENFGSKEMERAAGKPAPKLTPGIYTLVGTVTTMGRTPRPFGTTTFTVK